MPTLFSFFRYNVVPILGLTIVKTTKMLHFGFSQNYKNVSKVYGNILSW